MEHLEEATLLRQQGHRLTPQRLQVLQVVKSNARHLTAEEIHAAIVPEQPYIDIATVYRSLQWLQAVGLVAPINIGDGRLRYEYRHRGDHHHHLICQECEQETEIPDDVFAMLKTTIEERYGFTIQLEHLAIPGHCAACRVVMVQRS
ncbi:hypothetical protein SE17_01450 [Kouleothrix aurantiaca]|uniref:Fur family transcriptional regulator n=1 Tax=Kouleothrix aurantiaca TaxID=186479 RepID=A0A0P9DY09_9CHLR|nr:hypothetical protein SE17_01450 [Kouleothrix aurantiaca]